MVKLIMYVWKNISNLFSALNAVKVKINYNFLLFFKINLNL